MDLPAADRVRKLKLDGIATVPSSRRVYPEGKLAAPLIGSVGIDAQGLTGLEAGEDELLGGANGERQVVLDGLGKEIERNTVSGAQQGEDLRLTIDAGIQARTEEVLADLAQTYQPRSATAIVMDPRDAEVLAMADWPSFDPSDPSSASPEDLRSMATGFTYEPGSTFKAFTVAGALSERLVTPNTPFYLPIEIQVADRTISDAEERGPETRTVAQILAQSSNVGAVRIGLELGEERFYKWIRRFGFGDPTGIEFPGEERGIVPTLSEFSGSTIGNLPIGQGLSVTPMQMAAAYAAIANGGILRPPRLILKEGGHAHAGSRWPPGDQQADGGAAVADAGGRAGAGRDRLRGQRSRLHPGREDRNRGGGGRRRLLGLAVRRLVRGLRSRAGPRAAGRGGRRRAPGQLLRRRGGGPRLRRDRQVRAALPRDPARSAAIESPQ